MPELLEDARILDAILERTDNYPEDYLDKFLEEIQSNSRRILKDQDIELNIFDLVFHACNEIGIGSPSPSEQKEYTEMLTDILLEYYKERL